MPRKATALVAEDDHVTLRRSEYEALVRRLEDLEDLRAVERAHNNKGRSYVPAEMVKRLISGNESRIKIWREHRGLSLRALAGKAGVAPAYLSEIESGKKPGSIKALVAIARALQVEIEDLINPD
jgi:DNA-binding XRE family transcriptional regulator